MKLHSKMLFLVLLSLPSISYSGDGAWEAVSHAVADYDEGGGGDLACPGSDLSWTGCRTCSSTSYIYRWDHTLDNFGYPVNNRANWLNTQVDKADWDSSQYDNAEPSRFDLHISFSLTTVILKDSVEGVKRRKSQ